MKLATSALLVSSAHGLASFGPKHCVSVSKNSAGSCVLKTDCDPKSDLSEVEFAFTCQTKKQMQKHSFGMGGFDAVEEFDTGVKCEECGIPASVVMTEKKKFLKKPVATAMKLQSVKKHAPIAGHAPPVGAAPPAGVTEEPIQPGGVPEHAVRYGPADCVSTWNEGGNGSCIMRTDCDDVPDAIFGEYNFGLICENGDAPAVRHLFGKGSFAKQETFDTMVNCGHCLGLDNISERVGLDETVEGLSHILSDTLRTVATVGHEVHQLAERVENLGASNAQKQHKTEEVLSAHDEELAVHGDALHETFENEHHHEEPAAEESANHEEPAGEEPASHEEPAAPIEEPAAPVEPAAPIAPAMHLKKRNLLKKPKKHHPKPEDDDDSEDWEDTDDQDHGDEDEEPEEDDE